MKKLLILIILLLSTNAYSGTRILFYRNLKIYWEQVAFTNKTEAIVRQVIIGRISGITELRADYTFTVCPSYAPLYYSTCEYFSKRNKGTLKAVFETPMGGCIIPLWNRFYFDGKYYPSFKDILVKAHKGINIYWKETQGCLFLSKQKTYTIEDGTK